MVSGTAQGALQGTPTASRAVAAAAAEATGAPVHAAQVLLAYSDQGLLVRPPGPVLPPAGLGTKDALLAHQASEPSGPLAVESPSAKGPEAEDQSTWSESSLSSRLRFGALGAQAAPVVGPQGQDSGTVGKGRQQGSMAPMEEQVGEQEAETTLQPWAATAGRMSTSTIAAAGGSVGQGYRGDSAARARLSAAGVGRVSQAGSAGQAPQQPGGVLPTPGPSRLLSGHMPPMRGSANGTQGGGNDGSPVAVVIPRAMTEPVPLPSPSAPVRQPSNDGSWATSTTGPVHNEPSGAGPRAAGSAASGSIARGQVRSRAGPYTGADELASGRSSFTVRQTPSDAEDEVLDQAQTRVAMRVAAAANAAKVSAAGPGRPALPATGGASPVPLPSIPGGSAPAGGRQSQASAGPAIRLVHQPGHHPALSHGANSLNGQHRRLPNRHASMPVVMDGVNGGAGGHRPGARSRRTGQTEDTDYGMDSGARSNLSRLPSDSPIDSQYSQTSSTAPPVSQTGTQRSWSIGGGAGANAGSPTQPHAHPPTSGNLTNTPSRLGGVNAALSLVSSSPVMGPAAARAPAGPTPASRASEDPFQPPGSQLDTDPSPGDHAALASQEVMLNGRTTPVHRGPGSGSHPMQPLLVSHPQMGVAHERGSLVSVGDRPSMALDRSPNQSVCMSGRLALSGAHAQPSNSLVALHKAVERMMLQDSGLYARVQASMKGISSLAKETTKLDFGRDASGATVINQYVVVKTLGRGAFGKVKLCLNTLNGQLYAVKMINRAHLLRQLQKPARPLRRRAPPPRNTSDTGLTGMGMHRTATEGNLANAHANGAAQQAAPSRASCDDMSPMAAIMREIAVMKKVDHGNVVRLHEVIDPPGSSYLMMVMEYCEGGCVMETRQQTGLTPLGEEAAREFFRQACQGLDYLHYNNVIHGDLKPENMLVSGTGQLKIADFGSSRFMGGDPTDATKTSCTPAFQSPEEISRMPVDAFAADLWALACCLYCFVFGRLPFVGSCVVDIYRAILTRPHTYPEDIPCSPALKNLLDRMLAKDPTRRLNLDEVMQHEWVTAGGQLPPLPCLRDTAGAPQVIHVTHAEQANAIDRSSLVSLIRARLKEKTAQPGEYLFKEGEEAHCVYMIMAGVVEMTQHLRRGALGAAGGPGGQQGGGHGAGGGGHGGGHGAHGGAGDGGDALDTMDHDASFSVDLDESLTLDHAEAGQMLTDGMNIVDGKLHIDRQQAMEMRRRMAGSLLGENVLVEIVVEVKGPGSVIGEISMDTSTTAVHRMSARAKGNVTVVKLTEENFFKALLQMYGGGGVNCGGSQASTSITASSVSDMPHHTGGPGGHGSQPGAGPGTGTGPGHGTVPGPGHGPGGAASTSAMAPVLSTQHLMVLQYLEDSGSHAVFPQGLAGGPSGGPGRFSIDANMYHHNQQQQQQHSVQQQQQQQGHGGVGSGASTRVLTNSHGRFGHAHPASTAFGQAAARSGGSPGGGLSKQGFLNSGGGSSRQMAAGAGSGVTGSPGAGGDGMENGSAGGFAGGGFGASGVHSLLGVLNTIHSINASRGGDHRSDEGINDL